MTTDEFSFAKFSMNAFYASLNARLVDMVDLGPNQRIVDMACGTGAVTRIIVERLKGARDSVIIALDQSATGLKQAMEELKDVRDSAVEFVQSRVEHMSDAVKESVDTIFYCNAIHYVTDKDALVAEVSKTLKPGGTFAFNTSFFEGGQTPESRGVLPQVDVQVGQGAAAGARAQAGARREGRVAQAPDRRRVPALGGAAWLQRRQAGDRLRGRPHRGLAGHQPL